MTDAMQSDDPLSATQVGGMMESYQRDIAPIRAQEQRAAMTPLPQEPKLEKTPSPPNANIGNDAMMWLAAATAIGGIAGALTRNHTTNALAAFTGTLEGLKEGNQQKFDNNYKTWEASAREIKQNNDAELAEYKQAIERRDLDERQRSFQIEITANKYRNQFMAAVAKHSAETGDFPMVMAGFDALTRTGQQSGDSMEKLMLAREARQQKLEDYKDRERLKEEERNRVTLSPEAIDVYAKTQQLTGHLPANVLNRLSRGDRTAVENRYAELVSGGGADNTEDTIRQQALFNAALKGDSSSLTQIANQYDAITSFERTELPNLERLVQMSEKIDTTGVPVFERWVRAGKKSTGDPDVAAFDFQYNNVIPGVARIISQPNLKGALTNDAREEIKQGMPQASSAQQFRAIFELAKADFYNRSKSIVDQYNSIQQRMKGGTGLPQPERPAPVTGITAPDSAEKSNRPVIDGVKQFIDQARKAGASDEQIKAYIRKNGKSNGFNDEQIEKFLRNNMSLNEAPGPVMSDAGDQMGMGATAMNILPKDLEPTGETMPSIRPVIGRGPVDIKNAPMVPGTFDSSLMGRAIKPQLPVEPPLRPARPTSAKGDELVKQRLKEMSIPNTPIDRVQKKLDTTLKRAGESAKRATQGEEDRYRQVEENIFTRESTAESVLDRFRDNPREEEILQQKAESLKLRARNLGPKGAEGGLARRELKMIRARLREIEDREE